MADSLRVMLVLTRLNIGGVSHQAMLLAKGLQERGCEVTLVCGQEEAAEGNMLAAAAAEGLRVLRVSSLQRRPSPVRDLRAMVALWRLVQRERPHVVQTSMAKAGLLGRLAARLSGVPVVLHVFHGHVLHSYFGPLSTRLFIAMERLMGRASDGLVTLTESLRRELADLGVAVEDDIAMIPSLMDTGPFERAAEQRGQFRAELGLSPDTPLIGMVGRLVPVKDPATFLEAARHLGDTHPQAHFVLVGDGELRAELEATLERNALEGRVTFTGWRSDLPRIYAGLDALVICSLNEGNPISALEAMAAGVPVVATPVGGLPDLVQDGETGLLVPPGDAAALAGALARLMDHPGEAQAIAQGAQAALTGRFSAGMQVGRYLDFYRDVLQRKRLDVPVPASSVPNSLERMVS